MNDWMSRNICQHDKISSYNILIDKLIDWLISNWLLIDIRCNKIELYPFTRIKIVTVHIERCETYMHFKKITIATEISEVEKENKTKVNIE